MVTDRGPVAGAWGAKYPCRDGKGVSDFDRSPACAPVVTSLHTPVCRGFHTCFHRLCTGFLHRSLSRAISALFLGKQTHAVEQCPLYVLNKLRTVPILTHLCELGSVMWNRRSTADTSLVSAGRACTSGKGCGRCVWCGVLAKCHSCAEKLRGVNSLEKLLSI